MLRSHEQPVTAIRRDHATDRMEEYPARGHLAGFLAWPAMLGGGISARLHVDPSVAGWFPAIRGLCPIHALFGTLSLVFGSDAEKVTIASREKIGSAGVTLAGGRAYP